MADMIIPDTLPLEPCPFCGGKGHIVKMGNEFAPCCMNGYYANGRTTVCYMAPRFPAFPTYEEAAEAWNNRSDNIKHGEWSDQKLFDDGFGGGRVGYICSACGKYVPCKGNYCSECGARMDGGEE